MCVCIHYSPHTIQVSSGSKKLLVRRQWIVDTKNVGVWYLCRLASKNLRNLRVPRASS